LKTITLIAALAENNAIGKDNELLWNLPDDFKRFKSLTTGNPIIMGRKTFESFPKPLPNRKHIIITRDQNYNTSFENCVVVNSLEDALDEAKNDSTIYVIGGGQIYTLALEIATHMELTRVHKSFTADAFFPEFDEKNWKVIAKKHHPKDEKHKFDFTYLTYEKKLKI
jgi:dihydrofolate reductase